MKRMIFSIIAALVVTVIIISLGINTKIYTPKIQSPPNFPVTPSISTTINYTGYFPVKEINASNLPEDCIYKNDGLPDLSCTPGVANSSVTQQNIQNTICKSGYAESVRPKTSYTDPLKVQLLSVYEFNDSPSNYELDHLISLELGGSPTSIYNLWPEPHYGTYNSFDKDKFENYLNKQVCNGGIALAEAQKEIATNWVYYWIKAGRPNS